MAFKCHCCCIIKSKEIYSVFSFTFSVVLSICFQCHLAGGGGQKIKDNDTWGVLA